MNFTVTDIASNPLRDSSKSFLLANKKDASALLESRDLRVSLVGNFAPRKCGIATFTTDIFEKFAQYQPQVRLDVYALQDEADPVTHDRAFAEIVRDDRESYRRAAQRMNGDAVDAVWIQHEFGIFGGKSGAYILDLVEYVAAPLVVTLHTVLSEPSETEAHITRRLVARARQIMVMSQASYELVVNMYDADPVRVSIIEHGAPERALRISNIRGGPDAKKVLMTFGLLCPGKGLETAIEALPKIVARHPGVLYRIVGVSHPNERRANGERYRQSLEALSERLGVASHIEWIDHFVENAELIDMLDACDIYLTPYLNMQQGTSGTLSYAVALGRAVVSTPYIHARELLSGIGGALVPPRDSGAIASAVNRLLDNPEELEALQVRTYRRGQRTVWSHFAANSKIMLERAVAPPRGTIERERVRLPSLAAFEALCDGTGMLQHGKGIIPDRNHGYCLDDNVRALMLINRLPWPNRGEALRRASVFASFIQHAWNDERQAFRNFMNFDRSWCEDQGSEDSNARAIWSLGDTAAHSPVPGLRDWAMERFSQFAPAALEFSSPRSLAFAALGAAAVRKNRADNALADKIIERSGGMLYALLCHSRREGWHWFESVVSYDNARLSQALIEAGADCGQTEWVEAGLESLKWILTQQCSANGLFRPAGSEGFGREGEFLPFDQQPLEAWATIDACITGSRLTDEDAFWADHAARAYHWFLGANDRGVVLADRHTGICLDGVTPQGANANCGAESLLAFHLAHHSYAELQGRVGLLGRDNAVKGAAD